MAPRALLAACALATAAQAVHLRARPAATVLTRKAVDGPDAEGKVVNEQWSGHCASEKCPDDHFWYEVSGACVAKGGKGYVCGYFHFDGHDVSRATCSGKLGCVGFGELAQCGACREDDDCLCKKCDAKTGECDTSCIDKPQQCVTITAEYPTSDTTASGAATAKASATAKKCAAGQTQVTVAGTATAEAEHTATVTDEAKAKVSQQTAGVKATAEVTGSAEGSATERASHTTSREYTITIPHEVCAEATAADVEAEDPEHGQHVSAQRGSGRACAPCGHVDKEALKKSATHEARQAAQLEYRHAMESEAHAAKERARAAAASRAQEEAERMAEAKLQAELQRVAKVEANKLAVAAAKEGAEAEAKAKAEKAASAKASDKALDQAKLDAMDKAKQAADSRAEETGKAHEGAGGKNLEQKQPEPVLPQDPTPPPVKTN